MVIKHSSEKGLHSNCRERYQLFAMAGCEPIGVEGFAGAATVEVEAEAEDYKTAYERVKELGRGKFGIVYEVRNVNTGRRYAAKHVRSRKRDVRDRTLEEIFILSRLRHRRIVRLHSAFQTPAEIILLTEYLSGGELFEKVAADCFELTEAEVVLFMRQICQGVEYMHQKNIIHLDLKPENIVCVKKDSTDIKILDFGLAQEWDPQESIKVMSGTPDFVSPEVVNYDPVCPGSDMWSVGVIAYVLLSGLAPFMGDTNAETYSNIARVEYDFDEEEFDHISSAAKDFISRLLLRDASQRLTATQCLAHSWLLVKKTDSDEWTKIDKTNLRKFLARRRWHKVGQCIRAMKRMHGLMEKRKSTQSIERMSMEEENKEEEKEKEGEKEREEGEEEEAEGQEADYTYAHLYKSTVILNIGGQQ